MIALLTFFGADRGIATLGVVSYCLVNFWLPIPSAPWPTCRSRSSRRPRRAAAGSTSAAGRPSCAAWPSAPCASPRNTGSASAAATPSELLTRSAPRLSTAADATTLGRHPVG